MARAKRYSRRQVRLVDCCLLEAAMRGRSEKRVENVRYLRADLAAFIAGGAGEERAA